MGRPLNKKYFGNRNIGVNGGNITDDNIGGEGIANFSFSNAGNYINRLPTIASLAAPSIPTGVQTTGVLHSVAINCNPNAKGTGYQINDILTDANGTTWKVTKLRVISASMNTAGSNTIWDGTEWIVWDQFINSHWTSPTILKGVTVDGGHHLTGYNSGTSIYGVWDGTDGTAAPTTAQTITGNPANTSSMTPTWNVRGAADYNGSGSGDNNAAGGTITFTYGVEAAVIVSSVDYAYGTTYLYGTNNTTTSSPSSGRSGCKLDVGFAASYLAVTQKGSGYIGTEAVTFSTAPGIGEVRAVGTIVLTTDTLDATGNEYSGDNVALVKGKNITTYQENAIIAIDVSDDSIVDIIKQEGARRFKVRTATTTKFLNLTAPDDSTGLFIQATDSDGYDYWVKKISGHKATLIKYQPGGNARFADNTAVHWTFDDPDGLSVKIRNA
jgi:hypothetical protein